jgi:hypothetical protein
VLVPYALRAPAPVNLGVRLQYKLNSGIWFAAVLRSVRGVRTAIRTNRSRGLRAGAFRRLNRAVCPLAASSTLSGAKVPHALALFAACPLAVSVWLFATAVAVAKASRHRGCATVTLCVRRVSCTGSGANTACGLARALRQAFECSGPLHEQEFMQTERATRLSAGIVSRPWKLGKIRLQSSAFACRAPAKTESSSKGANAARLSNQGVCRAWH